MDWNTIIYAAIGGGLGGTLGPYLSRLFGGITASKTARSGEQTEKRSRGTLTIILIIAGINLFPLLYKQSVLPQIVPLDTFALHKELPILPIIQEQDPESYDRMMVTMKAAIRRGKFNQDELNAFRAEYTKIIQEKSALASPDTLRGILKVNIEQYQILKQKAPEICTKQVNGLPFPSLDKYLDDDFLKKEQDELVKLFTNEPRPADIKIDLVAGEKLFADWIQDYVLENQLTNSNPVDSPDVDNRADHEKLCDFNIAIQEFTGALSDEDFFNVTGFLNQQ